MSQTHAHPGPVLTASRETPRGLLQWRITVRDDGARGFDGVLPTLIQWGGIHPVATLPASGLQLRGLSLAHPRAAALNAALDAIGLRVRVREGEALIGAQLHDGRQALDLRAKP